MRHPPDRQFQSMENKYGEATNVASKMRETRSSRRKPVLATARFEERAAPARIHSAVRPKERFRREPGVATLQSANPPADRMPISTRTINCPALPIPSAADTHPDIGRRRPLRTHI